jgi:CRP/FNR family transcriptional regulator, cyclic AMP receptor protein
MSPTQEATTFQNRLAALPLETYRAGETVLAEGTKTGRLLILKKGRVSIVKDGIEIAGVTEPGAVFGELSLLLGQPHAADVRTSETSEFHVADAALLGQEPIALLYVATLVARRLDGANRALVELKTQIRAGQPSSLIGKTLEKMEELLSATDSGLVYAGYPSDPLA